VTVKPDEPLLVAYGRMKQQDLSQLPVLEGGKVVGILDESDLLAAAAEDEQRLRDPVRDHMTTRLQTVPASARPKDVLPLLAQGLVAIVMDGDQLLGLVTRMDVLNHLRRRLQ
jgi:cystathionine beta-synthase